MKRKIKTLNEFLATQTGTETETETGTETPVKRPSPIRRGKPVVVPAPKATAEEVLDKFLYELKQGKGKKVEININKIRSKYGN